YANCLKAVGRLDEALVEFERTLRENPDALACYANLADLVTFTRDNGHFRNMERAIAAAEEPDSARYTALHFALGKAHDDIGDHAGAIADWQRGAALRRRELDYDEGETLAFFDAIIAGYGPDFFAAPPFAGNPSPVPVFIVGMPRSGSTLVE